MPRLSPIPLAIVLALVIAAPGYGQDATVDPDDPSGAEYAIPIEKARDDASKDGGEEKPAGDRSAPLFGEGIEKKSDTESDKDESGQSSDSSSNPDEDDDDGTAGVSNEPTSAEADGAGVSGSALSAGLAGLALLSGAALGLSLRRRRRRDS